MEEQSASLYTRLRDDPAQFRLITIHAGEASDVVCDLNVVEWQDDIKPVYETISYVWGDDSQRGSVTINGRHVDVPESAEAVLRRVRLPDKGRVVWIDAVCINQGDEKERATQVQMMGRIYSGGTNNLIHLYREDNAEIIDHVQRLTKDAEANGQLAELYSETGEPNINYGLLKTPFNNHTMIALFKSAWFWRVWTFQEACLAKKNTCLCGPHEFDLLDLTRVATLLNHNALIKATPGAKQLKDLTYPISILQRRIDESYGRKSATLLGHPLKLAEAVWERQCQRVVDKVYGTLGLMPSLGLVPDYSKSKGQVWQEFAIAVVEECKDVGILGFVHRTLEQQNASFPELPSWVPDWSQTPDAEQYGSRLRPIFLAGSGQVPEVSACIDPGGGAVLKVRGVLFDRVVVSTSTRPYSAPLKDLVRARTRIMAMIENLSNLIGRDREVQGAIAVALCGGANYLGERIMTHAALDGYDAWVRHARDGVEIPPLSEISSCTSTDTTAAFWYEVCVFSTIYRRELFFMLNKMTFGLGPGLVQTGDIVVLLNRYEWPVVLRPKGKRYLFLGDAYVHGIMHGRVFQDTAAAEVKYEDFEIC